MSNAAALSGEAFPPLFARAALSLPPGSANGGQKGLKESHGPALEGVPAKGPGAGTLGLTAKPTGSSQVYTGR